MGVDDTFSKDISLFLKNLKTNLREGRLEKQ
jgi:hypothetical protein